MGFFQAVNSVFANYFRFSGRASMSEYWYFFLFEVLVGGALLGVDIWYLLSTINAAGTIEGALLQISIWDFMLVYYSVFTFCPRLAVTIRRLHDAGMSGFMYLLNFVPIIGPMIVFVLMLFPSDDDNIHGPRYFGPGGGRGPGASGGGAKRHDPMQGYAVLDRAKAAPTPEMIAARKAEVNALYRQRVLGESVVPAE